MKIVLASESPYRKALLSQLQLDVTCQSSEVNEDIAKQKGLTPQDLALVLAKEKAKALASLFPNALLIGGDQVIESQGAILSKPITSEKAVAQLQQLQGTTHRLWSATSVYSSATKQMASRISCFEMTMRKLSEKEIRMYIERDQPLDCAGSFKIESLGIALFSEMKGKDYTTIVGMSLVDVVDCFEELGHSIWSLLASQETFLS